MQCGTLKIFSDLKENINIHIDKSEETPITARIFSLAEYRDSWAPAVLLTGGAPKDNIAIKIFLKKKSFFSECYAFVKWDIKWGSPHPLRCSSLSKVFFLSYGLLWAMQITSLDFIYSILTHWELTSKTSSGMAAFHLDVDLMCS